MQINNNYNLAVITMMNETENILNGFNKYISIFIEKSYKISFLRQIHQII